MKLEMVYKKQINKMNIIIIIGTTGVVVLAGALLE